MNAEEILNNGSISYNLSQEFNTADTVKNIIKEEFDIKSDPGESYHVNYYDNPTVLNTNDDLGLNDVNNEETTYAPLKTVDFERLSSLKSFHTSPVKSSTEKSHQDFCKNDLSSPRKLGASKKRRSSKTCKRNSKSIESSEETNIFNNEMTVVNNTDNVEKELDLKEFISDVENENIFLTQMILQDESIGHNINDVEKEIVVKESMDYLKNETIDQTSITPAKDNEVVNSTDNLDRGINIKECIDDVPIDNIFPVPITPEKHHNGHEENDPLYITPIKELDSKENNVLDDLTPSILEDNLDSDGEYDKICNEKLSTLCQNDSKTVCSDSEFERMCDTIKSNNYEPARFSFETIELLNEFNDLDQSTNNNLLAELLTTPVTHDKKNQDYMITIDPLIDSSTSINSVSDTSDDSDLGIEIKSRHIRKLIASNAQRKKFLRANRKSGSSLNNLGIENKDDKFDKRKKRTKKMISNSRRKRLKSNEMSSFEDDDSNDSNGDKVDNILQESTSEFKVKRKRTRKVYNNVEQRRSSRLLEKSVNIKNINEDIEESLGDTSRKISKTRTGIISDIADNKNRKSFSRLKKPSNNTANQSIAEMDLDNNLPTDLKNTMNKNNEEYFASEKIMTNIKRERSDSIDKFFSDDESQRNYEELTNTSINNQNFSINDGVDTEVIKKRRVRKKVPSDFVRRSSSRIREKSRDDRDIDDKENHENIRVNPGIENEDFKGKKKQGESMGRGRGKGRRKSIKIEEQSCDDAEYENIGDDRHLKLRIKLKNRGTNKAGRSWKVEEFDDENQSDTKEIVGEQNLIEKHTPSRIKINGKCEDKQTSRRKSISVKSEPEISDAADDYDSDSSGLPSSEMSMISEESEVEIVEEKVQRIGPKILNKFINLEVELEHEVPIQHQLETSLLKPMTEELKCLFGKYSKLERQNFRLEEDKIIQRNWNRFCEVHDLDPSCAKILLERHNNRKRLLLAYMKDKIKLVQFLARDLPNRLLHQVCKRFRALYRGTKQKNYYKSKSTCKRFTSKNDRLIIVYITQNQTNIEKSCKELAELLGYTESAVLSRYHYLKDRKARVRKGRQLIEWDVPLTEKYIKNLMELTLSDEIEELKYAKIPKVVWIEMEKKMNIPKSKLMQFWHCQLHMQLFHPKCIISSELRIMLIEYLYVKGISTRREIDWTVVAQHFDGATNEGLSRLFSSMVAMSPFPDKENLSEVIEWLYEVKIPRIMRAKSDNYLPRLIYKNGKIEVIDDYPYEKDTKLD